MHRNCPVCTSEKYTLVFHDHNRREGYSELEGDYVECSLCHMHYLTNIPSFEEMGGKYEDIYVLPDTEILRSRLVNQPISHHKKILDIGCNHGLQLIPYYNNGWDVYGIDLNEKAIIDIKKIFPQKNFILSTIEDAPFEDWYFQKIQTFHVLEHVYEPYDFLRKCHTLLEEGGDLEIRIPNGGSLEMRIWWKYASQSWVPFHINLFDPKTIDIILKKIWFTAIRIKTNPLPWWWILSFRQWKWTINLSRGVTNFRQNLFHKLLTVLLYPPLFILSLMWYGEELHIFAKK